MSTYIATKDTNIVNCNNKINSIKQLREATRIGLKEAKIIIDAIEENGYYYLPQDLETIILTYKEDIFHNTIFKVITEEGNTLKAKLKNTLEFAVDNDDWEGATIVIDALKKLRR
jgi:protein-arginine kinase activator protein McsA